jgi:hypothetical protein
MWVLRGLRPHLLTNPNKSSNIGVLCYTHAVYPAHSTCTCPPAPFLPRPVPYSFRGKIYKSDFNSL